MELYKGYVYVYAGHQGYMRAWCMCTWARWAWIVVIKRYLGVVSMSYEILVKLGC